MEVKQLAKISKMTEISLFRVALPEQWMRDVLIPETDKEISGKDITLKGDISVISEIFGQLCFLHTPLVLWQLTSARLGQMVGVTHCPMVWVAGAFG